MTPLRDLPPLDGARAIPNPDHLKQAAWDLFVTEYTSGIDKDPGDARARYLATVDRIDAIFGGQGNGCF